MKILKKGSFLLFVLLLAICVAAACVSEKDNEGETAENGVTASPVSDDATDTVTDGETDTVTTEGVTTEAPETGIVDADGTVITDDELYGWFEQGSALILRDKFEVDNRDSLAISMAKNEKEAFQYIVASNVDYEDLRCEVSVLTDGNGNTLDGTVYVAWNFYVRKSYSSYARGLTPSALLEQDNPYQGGTFDVKGGCSKTLYVLYETDANTVPGTYTGKLEIKQGDTVLLTGDVSVKVWNIYYEEATECITIFQYGYSHEEWEEEIAPPSAPDFALEPRWNEIYADFLLDNRLSLYRLPVGEEGLLDPLAEKYMDDPRLTMVLLVDSQQKNLYLQWEEALDRGWLDKVSFLQFDEPHEEGHMDVIKSGIRGITRLFETTQHINPFYVDLPKDGMTVIERLAQWSTVHCPKTPYFDANKEAFLSLKEERGDTLLWYVCGDQPYNMIDTLPCVPGTEKRILYWQQYQNNVDGFLYYHTTWWEGTDDIWEEGYEEKRQRFPTSMEEVSGNGLMLYWDPITQEPVSTLNLESMRDGVEDFQLMRMAEAVLGKDVVMQYVERITTSLTEFTTDADLLMQVRDELAVALEEAMAQ